MGIEPMTTRCLVVALTTKLLGQRRSEQVRSLGHARGRVARARADRRCARVVAGGRRQHARDREKRDHTWVFVERYAGQRTTSEEHEAGKGRRRRIEGNGCARANNSGISEYGSFLNRHPRSLMMMVLN